MAHTCTLLRDEARRSELMTAIIIDALKVRNAFQCAFLKMPGSSRDFQERALAPMRYGALRFGAP